jgi:hypothetical protein
MVHICRLRRRAIVGVIVGCTKELLAVRNSTARLLGDSNLIDTVSVAVLHLQRNPEGSLLSSKECGQK